jgi:hypothetical protein
LEEIAATGTQLLARCSLDYDGRRQTALCVTTIALGPPAAQQLHTDMQALCYAEHEHLLTPFAFLSEANAFHGALFQNMTHTLSSLLQSGDAFSCDGQLKVLFQIASALECLAARQLFPRRLSLDSVYMSDERTAKLLCTDVQLVRDREAATQLEADLVRSFGELLETIQQASALLRDLAEMREMVGVCSTDVVTTMGEAVLRMHSLVRHGGMASRHRSAISSWPLSICHSA